MTLLHEMKIGRRLKKVELERSEIRKMIRALSDQQANRKKHGIPLIRTEARW
jgi:hypothetical protein